MAKSEDDDSVLFNVKNYPVIANAEAVLTGIVVDQSFREFKGGGGGDKKT